VLALPIQALNSLLFPLAEPHGQDTSALQRSMITSGSVLVLLRALSASSGSPGQGEYSRGSPRTLHESQTL
jgi:hypothetical protein